MSSKSHLNPEVALLAVAERATRQVRDGDVLGLGSGSTVARFAKVLGERVKKDKLDVCVVPSSMQAWILARENGLEFLPDSAHCPNSIDIAVDGADQVATKTRSMIKGGGGQLLREKIVLASSRRTFILVQRAKVVERLSRSVPIEVVQFALETVQEKLKRDFDAKAVLRKLDKGYPYYTESGNVILDAEFRGEVKDPKSLEATVKGIPGVVEVGVFNCKVDKFFIGNQDGSVEAI